MDYFLITVILLIVAVIYIKLAEKFNIIDTPNNRSSHTKPTIRGGGILFYMAVLIFFVISNFQYPYFIVGVSVIAILSFIDDLVMLSPKIRLPFQFIAIFLLLLELNMQENPFWVVLLLLVIGVGFLNLFNFMDGINGITGLYGLTVLLSLLFINYKEHIVSNQFIGFIICSIVVFGYYNFRKKARFFAGDIGSITLAMVVLFLVLNFIVKLNAPILLVMVSVYGVDSVLTILYRIYLKEKITEGHRHHIYQKLVDNAHWSHLKVSGVYALVQLLLNILVIYTYQVAFSIQLGILIGVVLGLVVCYKFLFNILKEH